MEKYCKKKYVNTWIYCVLCDQNTVCLNNTQTIIHVHVFIESTVCTFTVQGWKSMWTLVFHAWLVQIFVLEKTCTNSPFCTISVHKTAWVQQYSGDVWSGHAKGHAKASQSSPHLNFVLGCSRRCIFFCLELFFVDFFLFFGSLSCCTTQLKCTHLCRMPTSWET